MLTSFSTVTLRSQPCTFSPPAAATGALDASLPVVTIHTPAMAQATAGPPPPERTLHIAADDRTLHVAYEDRTITIGAT